MTCSWQLIKLSGVNLSMLNVYKTFTYISQLRRCASRHRGRTSNHQWYNKQPNNFNLIVFVINKRNHLQMDNLTNNTLYSYFFPF